MASRKQRPTKATAAKTTVKTTAKTKTQKADQSKRPSAFLALPPELRNRIYELTMPENDTIRLLTCTSNRSPFLPGPALAYTCREIYAEYPLRQYYANNTVLLSNQICSSRAVLDHVSNLHEKAGVANAIRRVTVNFPLRLRIPARQGQGVFKTTTQALFAISRQGQDSVVIDRHFLIISNGYMARVCRCKISDLDTTIPGLGTQGLLQVVQSHCDRMKQDLLLDRPCPLCRGMKSKQGSLRESGKQVVWE